VQADQDFALMKATVRDETGRVLATGHKSCSRQAFPAGWTEKAESGGVARALGFLGYGREYAEDETGEDLIPTASYAKPQAPEPGGPITADQRRAIATQCRQKGVESPQDLDGLTRARRRRCSRICRRSRDNTPCLRLVRAGTREEDP
jgi:hypothetical protein